MARGFSYNGARILSPLRVVVVFLSSLDADSSSEAGNPLPVLLVPRH